MFTARSPWFQSWIKVAAVGRGSLYSTGACSCITTLDSLDGSQHAATLFPSKGTQSTATRRNGPTHLDVRQGWRCEYYLFRPSSSPKSIDLARSRISSDICHSGTRFRTGVLA